MKKGSDASPRELVKQLYNLDNPLCLVHTLTLYSVLCSVLGTESYLLT